MHTPGGPIFPTNYLSTEFIDRMALINHEHDPISFHEHVGPTPTFFFGVYNSATTRAARLQRRKENVADLLRAVKLLNILSLDGRGER
jgi:hypothetical protein